MGGPGFLGAWLSPVVWFTLPALVLADGPGGLWVALLVVVAPLLAVAAAARGAEARDAEAAPLFHVTVLFLVVAVLIWANLLFVADLAGRWGAPRWHGVAFAAGGGLALAAWRGANRLAGGLLWVAASGITVPLVVLALASGVGPVGAWSAVASRSGFHFPSRSPWVTDGRELRLAPGRAAIVFEEEHRISVAGAGAARLRSADVARGSEAEWALPPGRSLLARPGDRLDAAPGLRIRFEAGKRIPGAPASGGAWATGPRRQGLEVAGLFVTLGGGALALLAPVAPSCPSRSGLLRLGGGLLLAVLVAEAWAVYAGLGAPELFLGGVTADGLIEVPALALGEGVPALRLRALVVAGAIAGFLASSVALRGRIARVDATGGGEIGHDLGLWAMVFVGAGAASLWPVEPWPLALLAFGGAASALGPAALLTRRGARRPAAALGGWVGLVVFAGLALSGTLWRVPAGGALALATAYPALVALPAAVGAVWLAASWAPE